MLPAIELADLRAEQELALPDTCTLQTPTETNTKGSWVLTYANTYTNVACRLAQALNKQAVEREIGAELAAVTDHILTIPYGQAIGPTYRVVHSGVTYEVVVCPNQDSSWRTVRRVYLKRVQ